MDAAALAMVEATLAYVRALHPKLTAGQAMDLAAALEAGGRGAAVTVRLAPEFAQLLVSVTTPDGGLAMVYATSMSLTQSAEQAQD